MKDNMRRDEEREYGRGRSMRRDDDDTERYRAERRYRDDDDDGDRWRERPTGGGDEFGASRDYESSDPTRRRYGAGYGGAYASESEDNARFAARGDRRSSGYARDQYSESQYGQSGAGQYGASQYTQGQRRPYGQSQDYGQDYYAGQGQSDRQQYGGGYGQGAMQYGQGGQSGQRQFRQGDRDMTGQSYAGQQYTGQEGMARRGQHFGKGPKGYMRSDDRIREDVNDKLTHDHDLDAGDIDVKVKDGEVTLSGTVEDRHDKRRAEECAEQVSGVKHVQNNIRVKAFGQSTTTGNGVGGATSAMRTSTTDEDDGASKRKN